MADNGTNHSLGTVVGAVHKACHPRAAPPLHDIEEESDGSASADATAARGYGVLGLASKTPYVSMGEHDDRFNPDEYWNPFGGEQEPNPDMPGRSPRRKAPLVSFWEAWE
mmetsp:Transcript_46823/g.91408  ORF Transcript_46823/g.91408 Transcript_46823/m.91408 type:complete len:110 (-) Transcript_46823:129-458(-)